MVWCNGTFNFGERTCTGSSNCETQVVINCTVGNASSISNEIGIINAPNALGEPDGNFAEIHDGDDRLTLDLGVIIPIDTLY